MCKEDEIDTKRGSDQYAGQCASCGGNMTNAQQSNENPSICKECEEKNG